MYVLIVSSENHVKNMFLLQENSNQLLTAFDSKYDYIITCIMFFFLRCYYRIYVNNMKLSVMVRVYT